MGVDYDGVGGIGIWFKEDLVCKAIKNNIFTEQEWSDDHYQCVEKFCKNDKNMKFYFSTAGSAYSGELEHCFLVPGENLVEVNENAKLFLEIINKKLDTQFTLKDLKVIADIHIW